MAIQLNNTSNCKLLKKILYLISSCVLFAKNSKLNKVTENDIEYFPHKAILYAIYTFICVCTLLDLAYVNVFLFVSDQPVISWKGR